MLEFRLRSFPRASSVWFAERAEIPSGLGQLGTSQLVFNQAARPPDDGVRERTRVSAFTTLLVDLTASEDALWQGVRKKTRGYIRAASTKIPHEAEWVVGDAHGRFYRFFAEFLARKAFSEVPTRRLYDQYARTAVISSCRRDGEILVAHFYLVDRDLGRARLLWSARGVEETQDVASLNRLLHWEDFLHFRNELQLATYDWGGIAADGSGSGIDEFKRRFGGEIVTEWNVGWNSPFYAAVKGAIRGRRAPAFPPA